MPTLLRFLIMVVVLAALIGAAILALATLVGPSTREMTITLPKERFSGNEGQRQQQQQQPED